MTQDQFKALSILLSREFTNQREFAEKLGISLGKANGLLKTLSANGWIDAVGCVTKSGLAALKPYKVDNAIIMAAGLASRFAPLSYEKPKGLLVVKGEVLIERQIRQLRSVGITDIVVVAGYMKDLFYYLEDKFKGLHVVDNDDYYRYNNTSTLVRVLDKLKNTYICSSDNYFTYNVFEPYVYSAYYAAAYFPGPVNEWGIKVNKKDIITGIEHYPVDMWCMMGHAYFDGSFSSTFKKILQEEYKSPNVRKELWEAVFERHVNELSMSIRRYGDGTIYEFDSLDDLRQFDASFFNNTGSEVIKRICKKLQCAEMDITDISVTNSDAAELSFAFTCKNKRYVYHKANDNLERT